MTDSSPSPAPSGKRRGLFVSLAAVALVASGPVWFAVHNSRALARARRLANEGKYGEAQLAAAHVWGPFSDAEGADKVRKACAYAERARQEIRLSSTLFFKGLSPVKSVLDFGGLHRFRAETACRALHYVKEASEVSEGAFKAIEEDRATYEEVSRNDVVIGLDKAKSILEGNGPLSALDVTRVQEALLAAKVLGYHEADYWEVEKAFQKKTGTEPK